MNLDLVTAALWPGQSRGGFKGHGGFRFDSSNGNEITVRAPVDSHLVQASKYLEGAHEQILLFFSVPCGFFYRFDHVSGLSPKIADALKDIPAPTSGDSRTTYINPPVWLEQGENVGTSVGIPHLISLSISACTTCARRTALHQIPPGLIFLARIKNSGTTARHGKGVGGLD